MSYYPPKGKEKKALERLGPLVDLISDLGNDIELYASFNAIIEIGHSLEGVRCNGDEKVTSISDIFREMDRWPRQFKKIRRALDRAERTHGKMEAIRSTFIKCPSCQGRNGRKKVSPERRNYHPSKYWEDCSRCFGRGVLVKEAP